MKIWNKNVKLIAMPIISIVMLIAIRLNPAKIVSTYWWNVKLVCPEHKTPDVQVKQSGYFQNAHAIKNAQMDAWIVQILYVRNVIQYPPTTNIIWKYVLTCMEQK